MVKIIKTDSASAGTKIRHRNAINQTLSDMPLSARRALFMALGAFSRTSDPRKIIAKDRVFRIYASEYAKFAKIAKNTGYEQLKEAAEQLQQQTIGIPKDQLLPWITRAGESPWKQPKGKGIRMLNVTEFCDYEEGDGYVDIMFSRSMEPYICQLKSDYTTQVLLSAMRLKDTNASNLYQLIRHQIGQRKERYFEIGVDELKRELGLFTESKEGIVYGYPQFRDFNRDVIKRSIQTIEGVTEVKDIQVEIVRYKKRRADQLRFTYRVDEQIQFEGF